jgi:hypothetical protein
MSIPDFIFGTIPERMRGGVARYIMDGIPPGDFLYSILINDFYEASHRADEGNRFYFKEYAIMLGMLPLGSWGSRVNVDNWIRSGGLNGQKEREKKDAADDNHKT